MHWMTLLRMPSGVQGAIGSSTVGSLCVSANVEGGG